MQVSLTGVNRTEVGECSKKYRAALYRFFLYVTGQIRRSGMCHICFQRRRHQHPFCTHGEIKPEFLTTSSCTWLTLWLFGHFLWVNNVSSNHRTASLWFSFFIMLLVSAPLFFSVIICVAILNVFLYNIGGVVGILWPRWYHVTSTMCIISTCSIHLSVSE